MKPPPFDYVAPDTLDEALALRAEHAADSAVLAGGQSLVPLLNLRLAMPAVVIDLGRMRGLAGVRTLDGGVAIGATTRQRAAEDAPLVRERAPLLAQALAHVGHVSIRNRGTVGGSLAHADPAAELPAVAVALDATLVARSARGERRIAARDFFLGFLTTALEPDELLVEVELPGLPAGAGTAFVEIARRHGDFALAGAAAAVALDADGTVADVRLALAGVGPSALRAEDAEARLRGARPNDAVLHEAAELATAALYPRSDVHSDGAYRRRVAAVVARRALAAAAAQAGASSARTLRPSVSS
jgi:carbon-monoxide dehydrogenase medium subunit